jgi:hypothetical protein
MLTIRSNLVYIGVLHAPRCYQDSIHPPIHANQQHLEAVLGGRIDCLSKERFNSHCTTLLLAFWLTFACKLLSLPQPELRLLNMLTGQQVYQRHSLRPCSLQAVVSPLLASTRPRAACQQLCKPLLAAYTPAFAALGWSCSSRNIVFTAAASSAQTAEVTGN